MARTRNFSIAAVVFFALIIAGRCKPLVANENETVAPPELANQTSLDFEDIAPEPIPTTESSNDDSIEQAGLFQALLQPSNPWTESVTDSAQFPRAYQIPDTEIWWKFGGFIKGDLIHDFQPAGTADRFVPITIPTDGQEGQNTLMQAKVTRLNLDVRVPSEYGVARGFLETDFFTSNNAPRIRHAYVEIGSLLAGQTWSAFTDPDSIPRTLDFESPIAFITMRQAQFRVTRQVRENLEWVASIENPTTTVDDIVTTTIPGVPGQPIPDFITRLKYKSDRFEWFAAGLFRELTYFPDVGPSQNRFGCAGNFVAIVRPTEADKVMGQFVFGSGLGRYRSGSDLGLESATEVEAVRHMGSCFSLTHDWSEKLSSTATYSCAARRDVAADPPDTPRFASYTSANLIWEPIDNTTMGIEYLYGTNETKNDASGFANRIQMSVQYNFP